MGLGLYPRVGLPVPADSEPPSSPLVALVWALDSLPTRAGTLDGGSSGGLLPKLPVHAGNSGRRCRRTAQRSDVALSGE